MKKEFNKLIDFSLFFLRSIPKTIYFNFKTFDLFTAIKLPVIIGYNVRVLETHKGIISFSNKVEKVRFGMVRFGYGGPKGIVSNKRGEICLEKESKLILDGSMFFGEGASLRVNGSLHVGNHFSASKNSFVSCSADGSSIGDNVMLGWNVAIRDSDGHTVYHHGLPKQSKRPYHIGNHVWICAEAHILKGVTIGNNSIIAYRSTVTRSFPLEGLLIGGSPAKELQQDISWGPYIGI